MLGIKNLIQGFRTFQPKRTENGLDLSYVPSSNDLRQSRLIAMCEPSTGGMKGALMRNEVQDVADFLNQKHGGHYRVYNLKEKDHPDKVKEVFKGSKETHRHFPIADHNVPQFSHLHTICEDIKQHLDESPENVAAIHCKAGKGRTGTIIVSYMLYSGEFKNADEALDVYAQFRSQKMIKQEVDEQTGKKKMIMYYRGVDQASQVRWIHYWAQILEKAGGTAGLKAEIDRLAAVSRKITHVDMQTLPNFDINGGCDPYLVVRAWGVKKGGGAKLLKVKEWTHINKDKKDELPVYRFIVNLVVKGEIKLEFWDKDVMKDDTMCRLWLHAGIVDGPGDKIELEKGVIDDAWDSNKFHKDFKITVHFAPAGDENKEDSAPPAATTAAAQETSQRAPSNQKRHSIASVVRVVEVKANEPLATVGPWEAHLDQRDIVFYYNTETEENQWEKPAEWGKDTPIPNLPEKE